MESTIYTDILFLANGLMMASFTEGANADIAVFQPEGSFRETMAARPAGAAPLRSLSTKEVLGAISITTRQPRNLAEFAAHCDRAGRMEKDSLRKLRYYELAHFARKANR